MFAVFFLTFFSFGINSSIHGTDNCPVLKGPYLGQKPPGMIPELFAPGIVSTQKNEHSPAIFSREGDELFWSYYSQGEHVIMHMKQNNGRWGIPEKFVRSNDLKDGNPFFSADWKRLIFHSGRGEKREDGSMDIDFWYVEKENDGWSDVKMLNNPPNSKKWELYGCQARSGNIYFTSKLIEKSTEFQLFVSRFNGEVWEKAELLPVMFNSSGVNWTPYVSPDESYIIFSSDRGGKGDGYNGCDLYISHKNSENEWMEPVNMGESINTDKIERFPWVSPDGKYMFFVRGFGDVYWVDARVIDDLKPVELRLSQNNLYDKPPLVKAEVFGRDVITTKDLEHSKISLSPDGKTIFWSFLKLPHKKGEERQIAYTVMKNGKMGKRVIAEFSSTMGSDSPSFWGNNKIIFHARRKVDSDSSHFVDDFWMVKREGERWSKPQPLGFNKFPRIKDWGELGPLYCLPMPSVSNNGNIYFMNLDPNANSSNHWEIHVSCYQNGKYTVPKRLPDQINSEHLDWEPFIAPDESYLIFSSNRPGSYGGSDIYISFRDKDDSWSIPLNIGEKVNTASGERFPSVSPDGRIMFFLRDFGRKNGGWHREYYWIDAGFLQKLRPKEMN